MTSVKYEKIYSRFFSKVEAYDFMELSEDILNDLLCNWLHTACANQYVRKLFQTVNLDDALQEINYEMKYSVDEFSDEEFIVEVIALGTAIAWLEPKINSMNNVAQFFGSKEEKFYSQSAHLSELKGLVEDMKKQQRRMIADRGYVWNTYVDGE